MTAVSEPLCYSDRGLTAADYETYNLQYVTTLAKRFHSQGYHIYLDYHFSDCMLLFLTF